MQEDEPPPKCEATTCQHPFSRGHPYTFLVVKSTPQHVRLQGASCLCTIQNGVFKGLPCEGAGWPGLAEKRGLESQTLTSALVRPRKGKRPRRLHHWINCFLQQSVALRLGEKRDMGKNRRKAVEVQLFGLYLIISTPTFGGTFWVPESENGEHDWMLDAQLVKSVRASVWMQKAGVGLGCTIGYLYHSPPIHKAQLSSMLLKDRGMLGCIMLYC